MEKIHNVEKHDKHRVKETETKQYILYRMIPLESH